MSSVTLGSTRPGVRPSAARVPCFYDSEAGTRRPGRERCSAGPGPRPLPAIDRGRGVIGQRPEEALNGPEPRASSPSRLGSRRRPRRASGGPRCLDTGMTPTRTAACPGSSRPAYAASSTPWIYEFLFGRRIIPVHVPREPVIASRHSSNGATASSPSRTTARTTRSSLRLWRPTRTSCAPEIWSKSPINAAIRSALCELCIAPRRAAACWPGVLDRPATRGPGPGIGDQERPRPRFARDRGG